MDDRPFGEVLKSVRLSRGERNRSKFARMLSVSSETVRLIEVGKRLPSREVLAKILAELTLEPWEVDQLRAHWTWAKTADLIRSALSQEELELLRGRFNEGLTGYIRPLIEVYVPEDEVDLETGFAVGAASCLFADVIGLEEEE